MDLILPKGRPFFRRSALKVIRAVNVPSKTFNSGELRLALRFGNQTDEILYYRIAKELKGHDW